MTDRRKFIRVNKQNRCPICGHDSWCVFLPNNAILCMRVPSQRKSQCGGWIHATSGGTLPVPAQTSANDRSHLSNCDELQRRFALEWNRRRPAWAESALSDLRPITIELLGIGYWPEKDAVTFPMRNSHSEIIGFRTRFKDGSKRAMKGSRSGLFLPSRKLSDGVVFICEGPTDTASIMGLGFDAIGRPSCRGCEHYIIEYALMHGAGSRMMVIVSDNDTPGMIGAYKLAKSFSGLNRAAVILVPPDAKDIRDWIRNGATKNDVLDEIRAIEGLRVDSLGRKAFGHGAWAADRQAAQSNARCVLEDPMPKTAKMPNVMGSYA